MITDIVDAILKQYRLPFFGTHGLAHWARVYSIGARLSEITGADMQVVELFALFHDACRENELRDAGHGRRGAALATLLRNTVFILDDARFDLLTYACSYHTDGLTEADVTVQTCWDSDRLDLLRCDIRPLARYLCTDAAKLPEMMAWANQRASANVVPDMILDQWGIKNRPVIDKRQTC